MSDIVVAGTKRKRYVPVEKDVSVKLTGKLHHGLKEVRKAVKKAKAFEMQRSVKKLKNLRKPVRIPETASEEVEGLEAQLESLKNVDHERIAYLALSSKIRKDRTLSSNDALASALASVVFSATHAKTETCHPKIQSKLLSSKFLAIEVGSVVSGLRGILEPDSRVKPSKTPKLDHVEEGGEDEENEDAVEIDAKQSQPAACTQSAGAEDPHEAARLDNVVDEGDDMIDDGGWESGSIDNGDQASSDEDDPGSSVPPSKRPKQVASTRSEPAEQEDLTAASTFLPSLSVGFIKGDSDSDFDESEEETAATGRKNRRGQRARQAIWEKKYGKNAKHIKKLREEADATTTARALGKRPDSGWTGRRDPLLPNRGRVQTTGGTASSRILNPQRGPGGKQPTDRPTHPSWEAKKKLKEKEGARILPSKGKKIVFG